MKVYKPKDSHRKQNRKDFREGIGHASHALLITVFHFFQDKFLHTLDLQILSTWDFYGKYLRRTQVLLTALKSKSITVEGVIFQHYFILIVITCEERVILCHYCIL